MTVYELLNRISARELMEWAEFYRLEPWGSEANFLGHAITSATVANVNRQKGQRAKKIRDFMPEFNVKKSSGNAQELFSIIKSNLAMVKREPEKGKK